MMCVCVCAQLLKTFDQHKRTAGRSRDVIEWQSQIRSSTESLALQLRAMRELLEWQQKSSTSTGGSGSGTCSSGSKQQVRVHYMFVTGTGWHTLHSVLYCSV
jgi:hypothetical protein